MRTENERKKQEKSSKGVERPEALRSRLGRKRKAPVVFEKEKSSEVAAAAQQSRSEVQPELVVEQPESSRVTSGTRKCCLGDTSLALGSFDDFNFREGLVKDVEDVGIDLVANLKVSATRNTCLLKILEKRYLELEDRVEKLSEEKKKLLEEKRGLKEEGRRMMEEKRQELGEEKRGLKEKGRRMMEGLSKERKEKLDLEVKVGIFEVENSKIKSELQEKKVEVEVLKQRPTKEALNENLDKVEEQTYKKTSRLFMQNLKRMEADIDLDVLQQLLENDEADESDEEEPNGGEKSSKALGSGEKSNANITMPEDPQAEMPSAETPLSPLLSPLGSLLQGDAFRDSPTI